MYKRNLVAGLVGIIIVGGFLVFFCLWLKAVPLIAICIGVMGLAIWDLYSSTKDMGESPGA
jgi:hypothetical protein